MTHPLAPAGRIIRTVNMLKVNFKGDGRVSLEARCAFTSRIFPDSSFGLRRVFMADREASDEIQAQLLRRISEQDHRAVAEFYDQIASVLFSTAIRILRDNHDAEEIIQEVFLQVWNKAGDFDPALGTPLHWTLAITRHRCIDRLRSRQRRSRLVEEMTEQAETAAGASAHSSEAMLNTAELAAVHEAVKMLPDEQRVPIELAFFSGLSHGEIAESLREPLGTVKARIRRGMMKLREHLKRYL